MDKTGAVDATMGGASVETFGDAVSRRLWRLDSDGLCAGARRRTGLEDFGAPAVEPALSVLVSSLEDEARLRPLGRFLMRSHLEGLLETRLRLVEAWKRQSTTLDAAPLQRPVFITGMPRSGSTFLHELMAEDPGNRSPRIWEVMFPLAGPKPGRGERQGRIRKAAACLWWFRRLAPRADAVHPMRAATPQECVAIQSYSLLSEEFVSTCRVPAYEAFLHASDLGPAYAWERRFLQHLQAGCPAKQWVLKGPDHVFGLEKLFSTFPDARIIQTHRNPAQVLKSLNQLNAVLRGVFVRPEDRTQSEARETRVLAAGMDRFIRFRDDHPELAGRFIDVHYSELVANPLAAIGRIYQSLDLPLTAAAIERMRHLAANRSRNPRPRGGSPQSDLKHVAPQAHLFERYCTRFGIS